MSLVLGLCFPTFGKLESGKLESTTLKVDSIYLGCKLSVVLGLYFPSFGKLESWKAGKLESNTLKLDSIIRIRAEGLTPGVDQVPSLTKNRMVNEIS